MARKLRGFSRRRGPRGPEACSVSGVRGVGEVVESSPNTRVGGHPQPDSATDLVQGISVAAEQFVEGSPPNIIMQPDGELGLGTEIETEPEPDEPPPEPDIVLESELELWLTGRPDSSVLQTLLPQEHFELIDQAGQAL